MTKSLVSVQQIREQRQQEAIDSFGNQGILMAAPRFGKIKTSIEIMKKKNPQRVLICFPRNDIVDGWINDFNYWGWEPLSYTTSTFRSLAKAVQYDWDFVIFDEIHEASRAQLKEMRKIVDKKIPVLALTGTMTGKTEREIMTFADLAPFYNYPISLAVEEGILTDYEIIVHKVPLSTKIDGRFKRKSGKQVSEKTKFDDFLYVYNQKSNASKAKFQLELKIINLLQNSLAKLEKTKELLAEHADERALVFCGVTDIADRLGIPAYHSKAKEKEIFHNFCSGIGNALATVKMIQAGITVKPINLGIINYTSGNPEDSAQKVCRFLGLEYNNPDKKAEIHIICADEPFEIMRIKTALQFFDDSKIKFV